MDTALVCTEAEQQERAFGRNARLGNRSQLETVRNEGLSAAGRLCVLKVLKTPPDGIRRAAFLLSRRFDLNAVVRNRARRLFREVFRLLYGQLPPLWILFIPRQPLKRAKMQDVLTEVVSLLKRLGVVVEP